LFNSANENDRALICTLKDAIDISVREGCVTSNQEPRGKPVGNLRAVQILLGHTKIENTVRYLGVDVEDALELSEATEV
jgi:hypothetical protein